MAGFFQNLLTNTAKGFFGNEYVRDYTHASKTFRTNAYQYSPKLKFLFHVYFEINPAAYAVGLSNNVNFGLAVKTVQLPKYTFDTHVMNQYNRKRIVQTKLKYDPITITFHDDNGGATGSPTAGGIIRNMWYNYYTYYYKDATKPVISPVNNQTNNGKGNTGGASYNTRNIYAKDLTGDVDWGYVGESSQQSGTTSQASQGISKIPFFKNIQIYGMNEHNFVQYTLVNPIITSFEHDTYSYAEGSGTMENRMTIDYETVVYAEGAGPAQKVPGFGNTANYDTTQSPIARPGANKTILGQGGLIDAATGALNDLPNNPLGALRTLGTAYNTFKNTNLKQLAVGEIKGAVAGAVAQQLPGSVRSTSYYPGYNQSPAATTAGNAGTGMAQAPAVNNPGAPTTAGKQN